MHGETCTVVAGRITPSCRVHPRMQKGILSLSSLGPGSNAGAGRRQNRRRPPPALQGSSGDDKTPHEGGIIRVPLSRKDNLIRFDSRQLKMSFMIL